MRINSLVCAERVILHIFMNKDIFIYRCTFSVTEDVGILQKVQNMRNYTILFIMINLSVSDRTIYCNFGGSEVFQSIIAILKENRCHYHPDLKKWEIPLFRYEKALEELQNVDTIQISEADSRLIPQLFLSEPELKRASSRLLFCPKLLRYPPFKGKPPYEDFQLTDILRAINRNRYGLFLDMGLGKAYIAAAIIAHLRYYGLADKVLLISSNIGAANMVGEIKKFIVDLDPNEIVCLNKLTRVKKEDRFVFKPETRIVITNYGTFRHISDHYAKEVAKKKTKKYRKAPIPIEEWLGGKPGILLLDESHALGNPSSLQTQKLAMHVPFFEYRYEFTGTPADKPEKLYSQLRILDNSLVHDLPYRDWLAEYNEVGNYWSSYAINPNGWKHDKLQALNERVTKDYAVYRKSEDCLDLPPNIIKKLYVNLDPTHKQIYQAFVKESLDEIKERTGRLGTRDIVNAFPYMQMALDNPSLLLTHTDIMSEKLSRVVDGFDFEKDQSKVDLLLDVLEERVDEGKERGIVWVYHPDTALKLMKILEKYNPLYIVGEIADEERMPIIEQFKKQTDHKILIAGIPVLNTSVTITEASFQVYFERVYNFAQYWQSMARIHRIGKTRPSLTYILIFDETIDVALDINLTNKDLLNSTILSKEFLSLDEWKKIFNASNGTDNLLNW